MTDLQKKAIFKDLLHYSKYQAGVNAGLDKEYKKRGSLISAINRIVAEVRSDPEKFVVSSEVVTLVNEALAARGIQKTAIIGGARPLEPKESLDAFDTQELVSRGSKKAWMLLNRKLDAILKSPRLLKETSVAALAQVAGISFDKERLTRGEATENIALRAKIDEKLTPVEALNLVLNMREKNQQRVEE